jgi:long-chain acyl-CoA synthetase
VLVRSVHNGETLLLRSRFDPEQTLRDIAESRATWFFAVPTMLIALADAPTLEDHDLSSLTYCVAGGAPLPNEVAERIKRAIGQAPAIGWGMTETSGAGTLTVAGDPAPAGVIGYPLPNVTIEIVSLDDPHLVVPPGEIGEIRIKGPNVVEGYWNRPEENAAAFADGFLLTGDVGFLDATGQVHIVDRKKDLIISSGFNVYPRAVEEAIYEHPAIEEVLVYGAPDRYRGEVAVAAIKLRNGAGPLTLEALRAFLSDKLGRHEIPARIEIHDALPRTAVGKLSKKELRETSAEKRGLSHD